MRSWIGILCAVVLLGSGCGRFAAPGKDASALSDVAISSGGVVGTGGVAGRGGMPGTGGTVGTGGLTTASGFGGVSGAMTASGGSTSSGGVMGTGGRMDAGRDLALPIRETEEYTSCASTDDCHVVLDECVCAAVNAQGAELVDQSIPCGVNDCLVVVSRVTDAVCQNGKCTLVRDPPCTADSDCRVVWARCYYTPEIVRDCACDAVHVSNEATRELVSPDGMCYRNRPENGRAECENGRCTLAMVFPG